MKNKFLISFFWLLAAVMLISSLGQSQVLANEGTPDHEQAEESLTRAPLPDLAPGIDEEEGYFVDEIPELAPGFKRVVIAGWHLVPWNRKFINQYLPVGDGGMGVYVGTSGPKYYSVIFPFSLPIGSRIKNVWWTGVDNLSCSADCQLGFLLVRNHWKGETFEALVRDSSGPTWATSVPFNRYKAVNHTVTTHYSYQIQVDIWSIADVEQMNIIQVTIDYDEPFQYINAIPFIVKR